MHLPVGWQCRPRLLPKLQLKQIPLPHEMGHLTGQGIHIFAHALQLLLCSGRLSGSTCMAPLISHARRAYRTLRHPQLMFHSHLTSLLPSMSAFSQAQAAAKDNSCWPFLSWLHQSVSGQHCSPDSAGTSAGVSASICSSSSLQRAWRASARASAWPARLAAARACCTA